MTYGIIETNKAGIRNVKTMIGGGSRFPSATAEKEMIKSSNVKLKNSRGKNKQIGKNSKSIPVIHPQWREEKKTPSDSAMIKTQLKGK